MGEFERWKQILDAEVEKIVSEIKKILGKVKYVRVDPAGDFYGYYISAYVSKEDDEAVYVRAVPFKSLLQVSSKELVKILDDVEIYFVDRLGDELESMGLEVEYIALR